MPELPEVESFRKALEREYLGKTIAKIHFHRKSIRYPLSDKIKQVLAPGTTIDKFARDGKQLVFVTKHGKVHVSLGMSGAFLPGKKDSPQKHEHVTVEFTDGAVLGFIDPRRFGFWAVRSAPLSHLADPLSGTELMKAFRLYAAKKSTRKMKDFLMDQHIIGGIGNIYALEALHLAGIRPQRRLLSLKTNELKKLAAVIPAVLLDAIDLGGSTVSTYRQLTRESGGFQELHRVYERTQKPCLKKDCRGVIKRVRHGGRSSWYCPRCQH